MFWTVLANHKKYLWYVVLKWYKVKSSRNSLFAVNSTFAWCVDEDLLKRNNLISPADYLDTQRPQVRRPLTGTGCHWHFHWSDWWYESENICVNIPLTVKSSFAKPTIAYAMRTSREPQDDGSTLIPSPKKTVLEMNELDDSLTFESSSDTQQRMRAPEEVT